MKHWTRALIGFVAVALLAPTLAFASPKPPQQLAKSTVQTILSKMDGHRDELRQNPQELYALINKQLVPLLDLPYMSQLVLGRYWRQASPKQRDRFETAFKNMLVRTYGTGLLNFKDQNQIEYLPLRAEEGAKDVTFRAYVKSSQGDKLPVSLKMHVVNDEWKVYDGSVGNLSFVTNYRSQFNAQIRNGGLEKLIERMEARYNPKTSGSS